MRFWLLAGAYALVCLVFAHWAGAHGLLNHLSMTIGMALMLPMLVTLSPLLLLIVGAMFLPHFILGILVIGFILWALP